MKKFILFFLVFLLLVGTGSLAFGFWNGKRIQDWAASAQATKSRHDIAAQEKNFKDSFGRGWNTADELKNQSDGFASDLDKPIGEADAALKEIGSRPAPRAAQQAKKDLEEYYTQGSNQIQDLKNLLVFKNQLLDIANIFDQMKDDATLEDIQKMIDSAKEKSAQINADSLPEQMKNSGNSLKAEMDRHLDIMEQYVTEKIDSNDTLMSSYSSLADEESKFSQDARKYIGSFQDIDSLSKKIDAELASLQNIKFDLR